MNPEVASNRASSCPKMIDSAGVPCGPIYQMNEVFADPQVQAVYLGDAAPPTPAAGAN